MASRPDTPCADCGKLLWSSNTSLPPGKRRCLGCRRANSQRGRLVRCARCGVNFRSSHAGARFCSPGCWYASGECGNRAPTIPSEWTGRQKRQWLRAIAPGLTWERRQRLLDGWVRAGVGCAYCDGPCESVDHVVPLSRGGTNHEGNLAPCCLHCNSSKCDLLLVEWRMGRPHGGTFMDRPWLREVPRRPGRARKVKMTRRVRHASDRCVCCGAFYTPLRRRKWSVCGARECRNEYTARVTRDSYRVSHGLEPRGIDRPTKPWMRRHIQVWAA